MNQQFSILIPYHAHQNTLDFVKRQLNYYHACGCPMVVILAVSGDNIIKEQIKIFINELKDSRFVLFLKEENNITDTSAFIDKIFDALCMVRTQYVVINGADDVIIPDRVNYGINILRQYHDIAGVKGITVGFDCDFGNIVSLNDLGIMHDNPISRIKFAIEDHDSIFYIIRRTRDLVTEYQRIVNLLKKSKIVRSSLYHIEHFKALSLVSLGKVCVFNQPWRINNIHKDNSTSHTESSFIRIKAGIIEKDNYEWFRTVTPNMKNLHYVYYKFLWIYGQIRGISVSFRQIVYHYLYKDCGAIVSLGIFTYFILHKIFVLSNKCFGFFCKSKSTYNIKDFWETEEYMLLKKYYFSEENIKLLESKNYHA